MDLHREYLIFIALFLRSLGLICPLPVFSGSMNLWGKTLLAFMLALFFLPQEVKQLSVTSPWGLACEFLVGLSLSLPAGVVISLASSWGEILDSGRGQSIGQMYDPISRFSSSLTGILTKNILWINLLMLGLGEMMLAAFYQSLKGVPLLSAAASSQSVPAERLLSLVSYLLKGWTLALLPILTLFLLTEIISALLLKVSPQLSNPSYTIKMLLSLLILSVIYQSGVATSFIPILYSEPPEFNV